MLDDYKPQQQHERMQILISERKIGLRKIVPSPTSRRGLR